MKTCTKCHIEKNESEFAENRNTCKRCRQECKSKSYYKNIEKRREASLIYRQINRSRIVELKKKSYQKNRDRVIKKNKEWNQRNIERVKAYKQRWGKENIYRLRHPDGYVKAKEKILLDSKRKVANLEDSYVKKVLIIKGFPPENILPELIESQRIITKIKRLCNKQSQQM